MIGTEIDGWGNKGAYAGSIRNGGGWLAGHGGSANKDEEGGNDPRGHGRVPK